jgi:phosphohistidine phosphatase
MQIFVLRHGQAEPQVTTDNARNLTEKGRADIAQNINHSLSELKDIQEIWASPLIRAQQTAEIVRDILALKNIQVSIKTTDLITPESNPAGLFNSLQSAAVNSVLLASHQPFVGDFIDLFCGGVRGFHPMNTSSMALIECDIAAEACGELRWLRHISR